ncbi:MAG: methyl-accepting chemotaxis protein [Nitrospirota bacterium]
MRYSELTSLRKKFLLPTLALTVLLLGGLGLFFAVSSNASMRTMMDSKGNTVADFMQKISISYYANFDFLSLEEFVKEVVRDPEVTFAVYYDTKGNPVTKASVKPENNSSLTIYQRLIQADNGTQLGSLELGYSKKKLDENVRNNVLIAVVAIVLAIALFAVGIIFLVNRIIIGPMKQTMEIIKDVARGNLAVDLSGIAAIKSKDEIGELARATQSMVGNLRGMIGNVQFVTVSISASSGKVKETTEKILEGSRVQAASVEESSSSVQEMHSSLKEITGSVEKLFMTSEQTSSSVVEMAASIEEVAQTSNELSSSIEETSTAINQMSVAIRQIAENVEVLSSSATETAASVKEISASVREVESNAKESASLADAVAMDAQHLGMQSIEKNIEGMNKLEATARRSADVVNRLGERAENIGSILTVIEDITDQTGLLALNAAILAAQAGEHGKGFAVVAAQIRELADRTAASTKEIASLIQSVQEESRGAVGVMQEEVSLVAEGVRLASDAANALKKILERADQSRSMSRSISNAAAEQTLSIRQVSDAIEKINEMTHQIAVATNQQKSGSEQITRASEKMKELTHFVKKSTSEQARGSKDISTAMEDITLKINMVKRAAGEVQSGSDLIVKATERIKEIAESNSGEAAGLNDSTVMMSRQSDLLSKEIKNFKMERT